MNSEQAPFVGKTSIIIPCYNESDRLDSSAIDHLSNDSRIQVLLVNDGSTDNTLAELRRIQNHVRGAVDILNYTPNCGKAEAVRAGLNREIDAGASVVGYLDADLATPVEEFLRLLDILDRHEDTKVLFGSRHSSSSGTILRSPLRQYSGYIFTFLTSMTLQMNVYDTQCGAKLFRVSDNLKAALSTPFISRWAFDVELLGRLYHGVSAAGYSLEEFMEVPLNIWTDVAGSKMKPLDGMRMALELVHIARSLRNIKKGKC